MRRRLRFGVRAVLCRFRYGGAGVTDNFNRTLLGAERPLSVGFGVRIALAFKIIEKRARFL